MNTEQISEIIILKLKEYLETRDIQKEVTNDSALIGSNALLDSLGLVNVIVDIESALLDQDLEVSLTSEKAMSAKISPFRSVSSLSNFIYQQLQENNG